MLNSVMHIMVKIDTMLLRLSVVGFICLAFLQITARYVFNAPLQWTEEVAVIVLTWMTYIGAWVLMRTNDHVRLEIIDSFLPSAIVRFIHLFWDIVILGILLIVVSAGIDILPTIYSDKTPALQLSYVYIFAIIPISFAVMSITTLGKIYQFLKGSK